MPKMGMPSDLRQRLLDIADKETLHATDAIRVRAIKALLEHPDMEESSTRGSRAVSDVLESLRKPGERLTPDPIHILPQKAVEWLDTPGKHTVRGLVDAMGFHHKVPAYFSKALRDAGYAIINRNIEGKVHRCVVRASTPSKQIH